MPATPGGAGRMDARIAAAPGVPVSPDAGGVTAPGVAPPMDADMPRAPGVAGMLDAQIAATPENDGVAGVKPKACRLLSHPETAADALPAEPWRSSIGGASASPAAAGSTANETPCSSKSTFSHSDRGKYSRDDAI